MSFSMIMALLMTEFTGEEILTQCLTLGPYLFGLGIGSIWGDRITEEKRLRRLFQIEWLSVILLPLIPLIQLLGIFLFVNLSPFSFSPDSAGSLRFLLSYTAVLSLGAGLLGGSQLPLIIHSARSTSTPVVLAVNYLGPLFAGLLIVFLSGLAFNFGIQIYIIGLVQLMGLFCLLLRLPEKKKELLSLSVPLSVLFFVGAVYPDFEITTVKSAYMNTRAKSVKELLTPASLLRVINSYGIFQRVRTSYQTIDFFIEPGNPPLGIPGNSTLYLNRKPQFDVFSVDVYHQTMIDGAFNLLGRTPETILILGAGDGLLLKELKHRPDVKEIVMVELDDKMLEWARENTVISNLNEGVLENPPGNAKILTLDGVTFLRNSDRKFDLILVDFPFPEGQELAKLYSREFYVLVKSALSNDGLVMVDLPLYPGSDGRLSRESRTIIKTMDSAGFRNRLLMGPNASFVALKTSGEKLRFDYSKFPETLSLSAAFNLVAPFPAPHFSEEDVVNTMFWPGGL